MKKRIIGFPYRFLCDIRTMVNHKLTDEEAVDSYSLWPILTKKAESVRKDLVYESGKGYLSLRTPELKLVFHSGSGGWGFPNKPKDLEKLPPMQLFNIKKDPEERRNIISHKIIPKYKEHDRNDGKICQKRKINTGQKD